MFTLIQSSVFDAWLSGLTDQKAKARILARLRSAAFGNFGDCEPVGEGISEMRIHVGADTASITYEQEKTVYVLLTGGNKSSQQKDIVQAKKLAREFKEVKK